jgi:cysteine synthase A
MDGPMQTGGDVDYFVAGAGTGGTITGVGAYLQQQNPDVVNICVEPTESRVLVGEESDKHMLVGIGAGIPLPLLEKLAPDQVRERPAS